MANVSSKVRDHLRMEQSAVGLTVHMTTCAHQLNPLQSQKLAGTHHIRGLLVIPIRVRVILKCPALLENRQKCHQNSFRGSTTEKSNKVLPSAPRAKA
jgi:hypothetical protein